MAATERFSGDSRKLIVDQAGSSQLAKYTTTYHRPGAAVHHHPESQHPVEKVTIDGVEVDRFQYEDIVALCCQAESELPARVA